MNVPTEASKYPVRPALRYYGSKWLLAPWIVSFFPPHRCYVEPFGGGASVLLRKPMVRLEIYNDIDSRVVNFFRVLRSQTDDLIRQVGLTPFSREELELAKEQAADPLEDARRFYTLCWQSLNGATNPDNSYWGRTFKEYSSIPAKLFVNHLQNLARVAWRMMNVQIENQDGIEVIAAVNDPEMAPQTIIYVDPPYVTDTRSVKDHYAHELQDVHHIMLAERLMASKAMVIVSGYNNDFYAGTLEQAGFVRFTKRAQGNSGFSAIECLWLNQACLQAYLAM